MIERSQIFAALLFSVLVSVRTVKCSRSDPLKSEAIKDGPSVDGPLCLRYCSFAFACFQFQRRSTGNKLGLANALISKLSQSDCTRMTGKHRKDFLPSYVGYFVCSVWCL